MRRHLAACAALLMLAGSPAGAEYGGGYSPVFTAPTPLAADNTNRIATTEWVNTFFSTAGFTAPGSGGLTRTFAARFLDEYDASDYSTLPQAITAAVAASKSLFMPCGTYTITTLTIPVGFVIRGAGAQCTSIRTTTTTGDVVTIGGDYVTISGVQFTAASARSSGYMVNATAVSNLTLRDSYISDANSPSQMLVGNGTASIIIDNCIISTPLNGVGLTIGSGAGSGGVDLHVRRTRFFSSTGARAFANILLTNLGDLTMNNVTMVGAATNMSIAPTTGQFVAFVKGDLVWFDNATTGLNITPTGTAFAREIIFENGWFGNNVTGVIIGRAATATVNGVVFANNSFLNTSYGLSADATGGISNIRVIGGYASAHGNTAFNFNNISGVEMHHVKIGAYAGATFNALGIALAGTTDNVYINDSDVTGNTTAMTNTASGGTIRFRNSPGLTSTAWTVADGGTGAVTLTGLLQGNGTGAVTGIANSSTVGQVLRVTGASTYAWGALSLSTAAAITGTLPVGNGGTGITAFGTGVATALGVNVGSAGAFVTFNGALGSPSSVGTMPAHTLGGTIAGGGNQINNIIIGTTTPLSGSFTTLTATGVVTTSLTSSAGTGAVTAVSSSLTRTTTSGTTDDDITVAVTFTDNGTTNPASTVGLKVTPTYSNANNTTTFNSGLQIQGQVTANTTAYDGIRSGLTIFSGTLGTYNAFHAQGPSGSPTTKRAFLADSGAGSIVQNDTTASTTTATGSIINAGGIGNAGAYVGGTYVQTGAVAVGSLPACGAGTKGARHFVTDANAAFTAGIGAVVAAGGANNVPVTCDGTSWRIG